MFTRVLEHNILTISSLSEAQYPHLAKLKTGRCKVMDHLLGLMRHMLSFNYPAWRDEYYIFSVEKLKAGTRNMEHPVAGSLEAWQSHIVLLDDIGLIKRIRASEASFDDPLLKELWEHARETNKKPVTLWSVPEYTEEVLTAADKRLKKYFDKNISLTHISKNDIILLYGKEYADSLYLDGRSISNDVLDVRNIIRKAIRTSIKKYGFALKNDILEKSMRTIKRKCGNTGVQYALYKSILQRQFSKFSAIAKEEGCTYHHITKEESERLSIGNRRIWIATKENE